MGQCDGEAVLTTRLARLVFKQGKYYYQSDQCKQNKYDAEGKFDYSHKSDIVNKT